jgi:hypothetical protein
MQYLGTSGGAHILRNAKKLKKENQLGGLNMDENRVLLKWGFKQDECGMGYVVQIVIIGWLLWTWLHKRLAIS